MQQQYPSSQMHVCISNLFSTNKNYLKEVYFINILLKTSKNYLIGKWYVSNDLLCSSIINILFGQEFKKMFY